MFRDKIKPEKKPDVPEKKWTCVFFFNDWEEESVAKWVKELAKKSGQEVRYVRFLNATQIDGTGNLAKIRSTIKSMIPAMNMVFYEREKKFILANRGNLADFEKYRHDFQYVKESDVDYWVRYEIDRILEPEERKSPRV